MHCGLCFTVLVLILVSGFSPVYTANILDFLWENTEVERRDESVDQSSTSQKSCVCNGPQCMCCVDFNLTYIDLGGPGCVQMKYISQSEGIALNVSYGESLLHSETVKGPNPEPTCMNLLVNLAQVCARFLDLQPKEDGLRGCLVLEPKLLGDVTATFAIGCFTMGPKGMKMEQTNNTITPPIENEIATNTTQSETGLNEEELIATVNETAEQGLAFFGNLLGLAFGKPDTNNADTETTTAKIIESTNTPTQSRKVKQLFKPNNLL
ncbi:unnamed protein product [Brassicogethes aeneus]|uniref:DUF4773 domain-containing protein n=1 Tax=Brassicogethes aeneus TaxID=1431903 RepID=A0A9P0BGR7_BRAAE|nr:unnamed protein product [Brassicogethes aeneus]